MLVLTMLSALLVVCLLVAWWWQGRGRSGRDQRPPVYPGALPIIGHAHLLMHKDKFIDVIKNMVKYTRENQCDSITLKVGPFAAYVITDPDDCLTVSNTCLKKSFVYDFLVRAVGSGLFTSNLEEWRRHRKIVNSTLSLGMLNEFMAIFNCKAKQLLKDMAPHAGKGAFRPEQIITDFVFETTCCTSLNIQTDAIIDKSFIHLTDDLCKVYWERFMKFWLHSETVYSWSSLRKKEDKLIGSYMDYVNKHIKRRSELSQHIDKDNEDFNLGTNKKPLIDLLLQLQHTENAFTDQEILHNLVTMLFASYDTTSKSLVYILLAIGSYEKVQQRTYEELQEVFGDTERDVDKQDLSKLVYLEAVIKETLRLYPVGAYVSRSSDTEVKLKQSTLPAGSDIMILSYAVNRHPIWGPDAEQFRPERWLEPGGVPDNPNAFAAFSIGKRACIGRQYAMTMMKVTLAHFLRRYRVTGDVDLMQVQFDNIIMGPKCGHEITTECR